MPLPNSALYVKEDFECIYDACLYKDMLLSILEIKVNGVFAKEVHIESQNWHYCCELEDGPNPLTAPFLPFPFTAKQLAAFMLAGWGHFFQTGLGEWADGPWQKTLNEFPIHGIKAKEAVIAAFQAYRDAELVVGAKDEKTPEEARHLAAVYEATRRKANASERVAEQTISDGERKQRIARAIVIAAPAKEEMQAKQNLANDIEKAWRKAMVLQLLSHRKERKVEYVSLELMVTPYLSKPFDSLPPTVAVRVREAFEPLFHWDNFGEQRRLQVVQEHDYKNDPVMEPVRAHYWKLVGSIQETEKKIRELELLPATKPSERRIKEQDLSVLRGELAVLEAQSNAPYTATTVADAALPGLPTVDYEAVATRQQLISAFGAFTGMDDSWFVKLDDKPKLKAARKFTGRGGRGQIAEPLFCPYQVMQWLVDPRRKTGRPLGSNKAWERLQAAFPKVYNQFSVGDTRPD